MFSSICLLSSRASYYPRQRALLFSAACLFSRWFRCALCDGHLISISRWRYDFAFHFIFSRSLHLARSGRRRFRRPSTLMRACVRSLFLSNMLLHTGWPQITFTATWLAFYYTFVEYFSQLLPTRALFIVIIVIFHKRRHYPLRIILCLPAIPSARATPAPSATSRGWAAPIFQAFFKRFTIAKLPFSILLSLASHFHSHLLWFRLTFKYIIPRPGLPVHDIFAFEQKWAYILSWLILWFLILILRADIRLLRYTVWYFIKYGFSQPSRPAAAKHSILFILAKLPLASGHASFILSYEADILRC